MDEIIDISRIDSDENFYLKFVCSNCDQKYLPETLNISIFLYGVFFLLGKEFSFCGITCPNCSSNIIIKGNKKQFIALKSSVSDLIQIGENELDPKLIYYSRFNYSPKQIRVLNKFDIPWCHLFTSGDSYEDMMSIVSSYLMDNPDVEKDYYCPYLFDGETPMGASFSIWWFKEEDIIKLNRFENNNNINIFPRYMHRSTIIEDIDIFCWDNYYYDDYLKSNKESASNSLEDLREIADIEGMDFEKLKQANEGVLNPDFFDEFRDQAKERQQWDFSAASDFMNILAADPEPWDLAGPLSKLCKGFWKTPSPFLSMGMPTRFSDFDSAPFETPAEDIWHSRMVIELKAQFTNSSIQEFLKERHTAFIQDYIRLSTRKCFAYSDIWSLKTKYLKELYEHSKRHATQEAKYCFVAEGPSWTIIYEGRPMRGLRGVGFKYLHYLVSNTGKMISAVDIVRLHGKGEVKIQQHRVVGEEVYAGKIVTDRVISGEGEFELADPETIKAVLKEKAELEAKIERLKEDQNFGEANHLQKDFDKISTYLNEVLKPRGGIKTVQNQSKRITDQIGVGLRRALESIKKHDEAAWRHFKRSLGSIHSNKLSYQPDTEIDWKTE